MGSSESTGRLNGTEKEEEERRPENDSSGGSALAIAAAGAAVAAWGISRMLSGSTDEETQEKDEAMTIKDRGREAYWLNSSTHLEFDSTGKSSWSPPPPGKSPWSPPPLGKSSWSLPPGRFKMNTDGSTLSHQNKLPDDRDRRGPSGYGGVLRDHRGKWVRGFRGYIGVSDNLTAEIHGIHKGLTLLDKLVLRESILESDCQAAVEWMERRDYERSKREIIRDCSGIIKECWRLIDKNKIEIKLVRRDANKCADKLANKAIESREEYVDIIDLPDEIKGYF